MATDEVEADAGWLSVEVVYGEAPRSMWTWRGHVAPGTTVEQALQASGLLQAHPQVAQARVAVGIWGRKCAMDSVLRERDRIELYRSLTVDPKEARRLRYRRHRAMLEARQARR